MKPLLLTIALLFSTPAWTDREMEHMLLRLMENT